MNPRLISILLGVFLLGACSGTDTTGGGTVDIPGKMKIPLWVKVDECKKGRPVVRDFSVLKMPDERVFWAISYRDKECRIYGAILRKGETRAPDDCDVRFRSKESLARRGKRCKCFPGEYELQEGRSTSEKCCARFPDSIHCKDKLPIPDVEPLDEN